MSSKTVDFGRTASDYRNHRAGFPAETFDRLANLGVGLPGQKIVDLGTGTGSVALALAARGADVTGVDISSGQLREARAAAEEQEFAVSFVEAPAEDTGLEEGAFDVVIAGQCWHWFDREEAAHEARRLLKPDGAIAVAHFDWLPLPGNVVEVTEALIVKANPLWNMSGGHGTYPAWFHDLSAGGFAELESFSFDVIVSYSHEDWLGRIRASAGVGATLPSDAVKRFNRGLAGTLRVKYPNEPLSVPHRVWALVGRRG